jgi:hypothetical protein
MKDKDIPEILNRVTDVVLAYRPKPKTKAAKKRKRLKQKLKRKRSPPENGGVSYLGENMVGYI